MRPAQLIRSGLALLALSAGGLAWGLDAGPESEAVTIASGRTVEFEYTLTLDDGGVVQSNVGGEPFSYIHGEGQLIPGLEQALEGRRADERLTVSLPPEDAYGEADPEALREVPVERVPEEMREPGMLLSAAGYNGAIRVAEVRPDAVVLDFNHPLAGQTLIYEIRILSVR